MRCWVLPHNVKAALTLPSARSLLQASGCVRDATGCIRFAGLRLGSGHPLLRSLYCRKAPIGVGHAMFVLSDDQLTRIFTQPTTQIVCVCVCGSARRAIRFQVHPHRAVVFVCFCTSVCVCVCVCWAMQAAGIEPAQSRNEPGDSTTDTAPTTTYCTHASTDGTSQVPRLSLWPSRSLTGQDRYDGYSTHTRTAHGFRRPQASLRLHPACMRVCVESRLRGFLPFQHSTGFHS